MKPNVRILSVYVSSIRTTDGVHVVMSVRDFDLTAFDMTCEFEMANGHLLQQFLVEAETHRVFDGLLDQEDIDKVIQSYAERCSCDQVVMLPRQAPTGYPEIV